MLLLSFDEGGDLHERLGFLISQFRRTQGVFNDPWLLPYSLVVLAAAIYFWPLVKTLPSRIKVQFVISGLLFVGSAFGMEMIEGYYETYYGHWEDSRYSILVGIEEVGEMLGFAVFIDAVLGYLNEYLGVHALITESLPSQPSATEPQ
jgi:hypothetical protein